MAEDSKAGTASVAGDQPHLAGPASGRSRRRERVWLHEHAAEHRGQWVVLVGDELLAADQSLRVAHDRARASNRLGEALSHFVPEED